MRLVLLGFALLGAGGVQAQDAPSAWLTERTRGMEKTAMMGRYSNTDYGFSIKLPHRAAVYLGAFGTANHGVVLILGERRLISAFAEYNLQEGSEDDKPCSFAAHAKRDAKAGPGSAMLGRRGACSVVTADGNSYVQVIEQQGYDRGTGILYSVVLSTTAESKVGDIATFRDITASFAHVRIVP